MRMLIPSNGVSSESCARRNVLILLPLYAPLLRPVYKCKLLTHAGLCAGLCSHPLCIHWDIVRARLDSDLMEKARISRGARVKQSMKTSLNPLQHCLSVSVDPVFTAV